MVWSLNYIDPGMNKRRDIENLLIYGLEELLGRVPTNAEVGRYLVCRINPNQVPVIQTYLYKDVLLFTYLVSAIDGERFLVNDGIYPTYMVDDIMKGCYELQDY